ncbi:MAG TPA: TolC family protein [Ignavibacteriaceae bacterium]|nr:TolC family protein [Ignavibacteriaceae bacterium]
MSKIKILFILLFTGMNFLFSTAAQTDSSNMASAFTDTLTVEDFVSFALNNNPQIKLAQSNLDIAGSNLTIIRSALYPQLSLQTGWTKNGGTFFTGPITREGIFQNYSTGFQAQQLIFDFGKTYSRISAYSDLENASESDFKSARQDLILNVYLAYFNFLQAKRLRDVNIDLLKQAEDHLKEAQAFFKVGRTAQFDVLRAQTDVENAKVNLLNSGNNMKIGRLQLENVVNAKLSETVNIKDNLEIKQDTIDENSALNLALSSRPELKSAQFRVEANRSLLNSAWTANLPSISAVGGYFWRTFSLDQKFVNSWNLGLSLSLPIFQGFALDAAIEQARANLNNSQASNEIALQAVDLDVHQQYSNLQLAQSKIDAARSLVKQSEETLKLAEGRFRSGVGSSLEVTDARVVLFNAQNLFIQSLYDYQVGYVRLQRAMGTLK